MGSRSRKILFLSHTSGKSRWQAALLPGGTCPLRCQKSWAAPSSPDRVPGAGRERWTPGGARSHGQAGPLFFSCAITRGKGVKNNDLAGAGGGRFKSSAWRWRARVSAGRVATIEGKGRGKIPFCRKCCWVAGRKACPGVTELNPQGQDLGVRVQPGS